MEVHYHIILNMTYITVTVFCHTFLYPIYNFSPPRSALPVGAGFLIIPGSCDSLWCPPSPLGRVGRALTACRRHASTLDRWRHLWRRDAGVDYPSAASTRRVCAPTPGTLLPGRRCGPSPLFTLRGVYWPLLVYGRYIYLPILSHHFGLYHLHGTLHTLWCHLLIHPRWVGTYGAVLSLSHLHPHYLFDLCLLWTCWCMSLFTCLLF